MTENKAGMSPCLAMILCLSSFKCYEARGLVPCPTCGMYSFLLCLIHVFIIGFRKCIIVFVFYMICFSVKLFVLFALVFVFYKQL